MRVNRSIMGTLMEVEAWFTIEATDEAARMSKGLSYWPLFVVRNIQSFALVAVMLFGGSRLLMKGLFGSALDLSRAAMGLLLLALPVVGFWWSRRRDIRKATELLSAINPLRLMFDSEGIHTFEKDGAHNFVPWASFDGFREGSAVILLRDGKTQQYRVIPKKTVPQSDVEHVRSVVRSFLAEVN